MPGDLVRRARERVRSATVTDARSLAIYRIVFSTFTILFYWPQFRWIATAPESFFDPPTISLGALASGFPPHWALAVLDVGVLALTILVLLGLYTRTSTILLFVLLLAGFQFQFSFGKIDHNFIYLSVLPVMAWLGWGEHYSLDARRQRQDDVTERGNRPVSLHLLAFLLAFGFLTAGIPKALAWIDFDLQTSGALSWLYYGYFNLGREALLAPVAMGLDSPLFWEAADLAVVIFETGWIMALFSRRLWYAWLAAACGFHLFNGLVLNIPFLTLAAVYLAFIPWSRLLGLRSATAAVLNRWVWIGAAAGIAAVVNFLLDGNGLVPSLPALTEGGPAWLMLVCAIWVVTLGCVVVGTGWPRPVGATESSPGSTKSGS